MTYICNGCGLTGINCICLEPHENDIPYQVGNSEEEE